jgi:hypothetical protein
MRVLYESTAHAKQTKRENSKLLVFFGFVRMNLTNFCIRHSRACVILVF